MIKKIIAVYSRVKKTLPIPSVLHYDLRSPYDGHLLSNDELMIPIYNLKKCRQRPNIHLCPGCMDCGNCKDVILVDSNWNPVGPSFRRVKGKTQPTSLDDFAD